MKLSVSVPIEASKEEIWRVITDVEHSTETLHCVNDIEILEKPEDTLNGLKWRETRTMYGEEESEVFCITDSEENHYLKTHAEDEHGMVFESTMTIEPEGDHQLLTIGFVGKPSSITSRLRSILFGPFIKTNAERSLVDDLEDIKNTVEHHH